MPEWLLTSLHPFTALLALMLFALAGWHARRITAIEKAREEERLAHIADLKAMQSVLREAAIAMATDAEATRRHSDMIGSLYAALVDLRQDIGRRP